MKYLPYGELFVSQMSGSFDSRFKFTDKERDTETNLDYFGARYYTSDESIWLSVDPMSDKYPGLSPYMYCEGNPMVLIDPGGDTTVYFSQKGQYLYTSFDKLPTAITIVSNENLAAFSFAASYFINSGGMNDNIVNSALRKTGDTYDVNSLRTFYNENTVTGVNNIGENNKEYVSGYFNETGALLVENNGVITPGISKKMGDYLFTTFPSVEVGKGIVKGKIHLHPNEGMEGFKGQNYHFGPSTKYDLSGVVGRDVIVGKKNMYFYTNGSDIISVDKNTLRIGNLDPASER